ncbi:MAG: FecR domain-containing protein [Spirochaetes bacterium]|nr:FecR domain-containing protein [Spirochaetota bacterium]
MHTRFIAFSAAFMLLLIACGTAVKNTARVSMVSGEAYVLRGGETVPLTNNALISESETVVTGKNGAVLLDIGNGSGLVEVQHSTAFSLKTINSPKKSVSIKRGNVWIMIKKLAAEEGFYFTTPVSSAAVRGTKFYSFEMGDMRGMCHCEGSVEYKAGDYAATNSGDYIVFTKDNHSIVVTQDDMRSIGMRGHNHSVMNGSIIGAEPSKAAQKNMPKLMKLVEKKFAAAKQ